MFSWSGGGYSVPVLVLGIVVVLVLLLLLLMIDYVGSSLVCLGWSLARCWLVGWLVGGGYSLRSTLLYSTGWLGSRQDGGSDSMDGWMDWLVRCGVGGIYVFWRSEPQGKAIVVSGGCCCFVSLDTGC